MEQEEILVKIKEILSDFSEVPAEDMQMNFKLVADLGLNSLDIVNIVMAFEDEFKLSIPDRDLGAFETISDIVNYIKRHN